MKKDNVIDKIVSYSRELDYYKRKIERLEDKIKCLRRLRKDLEKELEY